MERLNQQVRQLKTETYAIYLASKDPRVPWYAKLLIVFVVAHTLSPIDLIPDFIPVIGYLDDLIITPLGILIALKMIPNEVLMECREQARKQNDLGNTTNWWAAAIIFLIWILVIVLVLITILRVINRSLT